MRRSASVSLGVVALLAPAALAGCSTEEEATHQGICIDQKTQNRIDDEKCDDDDSPGHVSSGGGYWGFYSVGSNVPAVGQPAKGSVGRPSSSYKAGGAPKSGGSIPRGGFGGGTAKAGS